MTMIAIASARVASPADRLGAARRRCAILALLLLALAGMGRADDSDLVKAAKANGGPKKPSRKVITNADVKRNANPSGGAVATGELAAVSAPKSELLLQAEHKRAVAAAEEKVRGAETRVAALERSLAAIEQSYYDATDLDVRDRVITGRFAAARGRLDAARLELTAAQDAAKALAPSNVVVRP